MRIVWRRLALDDLAALQAYIAEDDPRAARRIAQTIRTAVEGLATFAQIGRPGRVDGTRELVVAGTPYIVLYRLKADEVQILRVYHAAPALASTLVSWLRYSLRLRSAGS